VLRFIVGMLNAVMLCFVMSSFVTFEVVDLNVWPFFGLPMSFSANGFTILSKRPSAKYGGS